MKLFRLARRHYGANPLQLLAFLASFALAGYAATSLLSSRPIAVAVWFAGAAVGHDVVLVPLYTIADRSLRLPWRRVDTGPSPSWLNYLRFPAAISLLLLIVFFPEIARLSDRYTVLTGLSANAYLGNWLAITGALFLISAVLYAIRLRRDHTAAKKARTA